MKIAIVQFEPVFLDIEKNFEKMKEYYSHSKADLILYPELSLSGYNFKNIEEVKTACIEQEGEIVEFFKSQTEKNGNAIVFGAAIKRDGKYFNSQIFISGNNAITYDKVNLFYRENLFFTPGKEIKIVEFMGYKMGMAVCFDWFHPEFFRKLAKNGAEIILHSANLVMPYCQAANITRSLENRVFIATANRVGSERELKFTGMSQITDPFGNIILKVGPDSQGVFQIEIDPTLSQNKKLNDFNSVL